MSDQETIRSLQLELKSTKDALALQVKEWDAAKERARYVFAVSAIWNSPAHAKVEDVRAYIEHRIAEIFPDEPGLDNSRRVEASPLLPERLVTAARFNPRS